MENTYINLGEAKRNSSDIKIIFYGNNFSTVDNI